ncbi:hypothetical protein JXI42_03935 [bacterium]|nr:hypothetical protein [bacterium]
MPQERAEITSAPKGTQYRTSSQGEWLTATVGTKLYDNNEVRNAESNDYGLKVYSEVEVNLPDSSTDITFGKIAGQAKYLDENKQWQDAESYQQYTSWGIHSGMSSTVPVSIKGNRGYVRRKPW